MNNISHFILLNGLKPADAIVLRKKLFGMLDHYVIYLGLENGRHVFVANYTKGVQVISDFEIAQFLQILEPTNIDRFPGPEFQRQWAVNRAISRIGEAAYDYVANNCEHFKTWVHSGVHRSKQSENFEQGVKVALGAVALFAAVDLLLGE